MSKGLLARRKCMLGLFLLALVLLIGSGPAIYAQTKAYRVEEGIVYSKFGEEELQLDLACPTKGEGPFAAIVFLPGNGWGWWKSETRNNYFVDIREAAKKGYVAAAVDYRLTSVEEDGKSKYNFPAQLYDVKCAIRWLRANALKYNIDTNHIGAVGFSSGGHLALLLGLTVPGDGLEGECADLSTSSRVQAVVSISGPTDLASQYNESEDPKQILINLVGATPEESPEKYRAASPIRYVTKDASPVLMIHGDKDNEVPIRQALLLDQRMNEAGSTHRLIILRGGTHQNIQLNEDVWDFLSKNLKVAQR